MGREDCTGSPLANDGRISFLSAREDSSDVDEVVADHAQSHPASEAAIALIPTAVEPMAALEYADAPFAAGPPFLPVAEPGFLLFPLAFGTLGVAMGNADALPSFFVGRLFIAGRVEGGIGCDQARDASQLFLVRVDGRNQQLRVGRPLLLHRLQRWHALRGRQTSQLRQLCSVSQGVS